MVPRFYNRLDMNTSGIIIVTKNAYAQSYLQEKGIVNKFYQAIDGDFEAACRRFYNENMLQKFLIRFLDEPCCAELNDALGRHDRDAAIKAVHTLTGQARSFGFIRLEKKSAALLQALRGNQDEEITELRYEVTTEYIRIVHAIRSLASELGIFM